MPRPITPVKEAPVPLAQSQQEILTSLIDRLNKNSAARTTVSDDVVKIVSLLNHLFNIEAFDKLPNTIKNKIKDLFKMNRLKLVCFSDKLGFGLKTHVGEYKVDDDSFPGEVATLAKDYKPINDFEVAWIKCPRELVVNALQIAPVETGKRKFIICTRSCTQFLQYGPDGGIMSLMLGTLHRSGIQTLFNSERLFVSSGSVRENLIPRIQDIGPSGKLISDYDPENEDIDDEEDREKFVIDSVNDDETLSFLHNNPLDFKLSEPIRRDSVLSRDNTTEDWDWEDTDRVILNEQAAELILNHQATQAWMKRKNLKLTIVEIADE